MDWDAQKSAELYGINSWGSHYFHINNKGNIEVRTSETEDKKLDMHQLISDLKERGIRLPILLRFPDIIRNRIGLLNNCFQKSIDEYGYKGKYSGVFPIKVNQQRQLIEEIIQFGKPYNLGLECGSKPELLIALAKIDCSESLIICNGFKDREYIDTALLARKLKKNTLIVVDRKDEIQMIIDSSQKLGIKPRIGFRCKLNAKGGGKWIESSGAKSKFGLTPSEIVHGVELLKENNLLENLELIHFHIGSQVPSIQSIKSSIKEASRFYVELHQMGVSIKYLDVGGGLGIDYDGSKSSESSTNYDEQEYANDVVSIIQSICDEKSIPHPDIISESGRALIAHSSVLVFDVLGSHKLAKNDLQFEVSGKDSRLVQDLHEMYKALNENNINEFYNDLIEKKKDTLQLFNYGVLSLKQRAKADDLYWAISLRMSKLAKNQEDLAEIYWKLVNELSDTYFCNFSIFQSLPDSWALDQIFPVMPIHKLDTAPKNRAKIVDLTCDSDGQIDRFIDTETDKTQAFLEVHEINEKEDYYLGVFLTGAYQEILGDLHNLFGDTDAVHISIHEKGYTVDHFVEGDSVEEVLKFVQYDKSHMVERIRKDCETSILHGNLERSEARLLMKHYEKALTGYTYLE